MIKCQICNKYVSESEMCRNGICCLKCEDTQEAKQLIDQAEGAVLDDMEREAKHEEEFHEQVDRYSEW